MMVILFFALKLPAAATQRKKATLRENIRQLDPIGTAVFLPAIVCLLLALQWGGTTYNWANARIIALLVLSGLLFHIGGQASPPGLHWAWVVQHCACLVRCVKVDHLNGLAWLEEMSHHVIIISVLAQGWRA